jgi:outer membrane immunogenic protein
VKKLIVVGAALGAFGFAATANAADMPVKAPAYRSDPISWTGCHVGASGGEKFGQSSGYQNTAASTLGGGPALPAGFNYTGAFHADGQILTFFAGCDYQVNRWVIGGEVDWSFTNMHSGNVFLVPGGIASNGGFGNVNDIWTLSEQWLSTARLRLGYAVADPWLLYVTGGAAWARIQTYETILTNPTAPETAFQTHDRFGWTVGAGVEYMLSRHWTARAEYLYVDLGRWTTFTNIPAGALGTDTFTNLSVNLHQHIARVGVAYKFDVPGIGKP